MSNPQESSQKSEAVLELYKHAEQRRGLQISRIWETMKLTTAIFFGLFTATVTILGFLARARIHVRRLKDAMILTDQ